MKRLFSHILFVVYSATLVLLIVAAGGCASASPRFTSARIEEEPDTVLQVDSLQSYREEVKEELKENDKVLDINSVILTIASLPSENPALDNKKVIDEVLSMIGTPYSYSGTDSTGIDCSGFTARVFLNAADIALPHSAHDQFRMGRKVKRTERKFGDLVFFQTRRKGPSHVGIFLGEDLFAHASVSQGVTISSLESTYFKKRYLGARRVAE